MRWPRRAGPTSSTSGGPRSTSAGTDVSLDAVVAAARAGDEAAFAALVERHRAELRVHCYRMLGSFDEAEDLVQETFLRAWKNLGGFEGRSTLRAWLYRIATNACLDALDGRARRVLPHHLAGPSDPSGGLPPRTDIAWLQPFPDRLIGADRPWEPAAPSEDEPDAVVVARETIELAFLAAIQHLPPRQRAELPTEQERAVLRRYMDAMERADLAAVADLLAEDVRTMMPPWPTWLQGRDAVVAALAVSGDASSLDYVGRFRMVPTRANRQPAAATYVRRLDDTGYRAFAISVLRIEDGRIAEATAFHDTGLFPAFDLPLELPPTDR